MAAGGIRELLGRHWFRWLFGTRLVSQCADGVFQSSLASAVFFNPDHQTDPKQAAAGRKSPDSGGRGGGAIARRRAKPA